MIKAIIFDWGGVLIDEPLNKMIIYCAKALGVESEILEKVYSKYNSRFEKGLIKENDLWKVICNKLNVALPKTNSLWLDAARNVFVDKKDVFLLLKQLKKNNYKIGFLSNTEISLSNYFYEKNYEKFFDAEVFSCLEKSIKPEKKIYSIILKKLGVKPKEAIFIDDHYENVKGAVNVGIYGLLFKDVEQLKKDLSLLKIKF